MNDPHLEKSLADLRPAAPSSALTRVLERELQAVAPGDPASGDLQITALEQALRGIPPAAASAEMGDRIGHELEEDAELERALFRLKPASVSNQTGQAIAAQMELRIVNSGPISADQPAQNPAPVSIPAQRASLRKRWMAVAAAVAVSCVGLGILSWDMPFRSRTENGVRAHEQAMASGSRNTLAEDSVEKGELSAVSDSRDAVGRSGAPRGRGVNPRSDSAVAARGTHGSGSGENSSEKGPREKIAGRNGGAGMGPAPQSEADEDAPSERPLEARKLASNGRTPGYGGPSGAISSRTLLGAGTSTVTAASRAGVVAPSLEPNLLETLASGRVSEVLPVEVIGLIREAAEPHSTLALSRQESAGGAASALQIASASPTPGARTGASGVATRGGAGFDLGPATSGASGAETSPGVLSVSGLITSAAAGVPLLGQERSVVLNAAGRVVDASVFPEAPERSPGGGPGVLAGAEQVVYESTDGAVTFQMVRTESGTVGRVSDATGRMITEGLVVSPGDVARIAQRAILVQQFEGTVPVSKGD